MLKMLIIGATSAIANETIKFFAADHAEFFLVARNAEKLNAIAADLKVRGAKRVETCVLDLADLAQHQAMIEQAAAALGGLDAVLIAHGSLGDQAASQASVETTLQELNVNFMSVVSLLTILGNHFEKQRRGVIAVIGSVAGDRGRGSNYIYGSAKAGLDAFLSGLRNRLAKSGVTVLTIKPGQIDTPMTAHLKKSPLFASPVTVGRDIYKAMRSGKDIIYTPFYWRYVMLIISNIPEMIFKKLSL